MVLVRRDNGGDRACAGLLVEGGYRGEVGMELRSGAMVYRVGREDPATRRWMFTQDLGH